MTDTHAIARLTERRRGRRDRGDLDALGATPARLFIAADERARRLGRPLLVVLPRKEGDLNRSMRLSTSTGRATATSSTPAIRR